MATSANSFSSNAINAEIVQITLSSTTGATANIVIGADSMFGGEFTYETLGAQTSHSEMGNPLAVNVGIKFMLTGLGETADWTSINELSSNKIAYVQLKLMSGQTVTLNSGADDNAIMYFNHTMPAGDNAFTVEMTGQRKIPYSAFTIS